MNVNKIKFNRKISNQLSDIISPIKSQTYFNQIQEPLNEPINPIESSIGFSAMNDDHHYINDFNSLKQVEIANDKQQNNNEIIVNHQVHERVIDKNYNKRDKLDHLLCPNDIQQLDFITTLLRLQKAKSTMGIPKNEDESKSNNRGMVDQLHVRNKESLISNDITGNCNLNSFLNDITPQEKNPKPQSHLINKKGLTIKDLIEITNKRRKNLNGFDAEKTDNNWDNQSRNIVKTRICQMNSQKNVQTKMKLQRHNSTGSAAYVDYCHSNNGSIFEECKEKRERTQNIINFKDTFDNEAIEKRSQIEQNAYQMNTMNNPSEQWNIKPPEIDQLLHKSTNKDHSYLNSSFKFEGRSLSSNHINQFELTKSIPQTEYNVIPKTKIENKLLFKEVYPQENQSFFCRIPLPAGHRKFKSGEYETLNVEINNNIYLPQNNTINLLQSNYKEALIKPIYKSSLNDLVNYGSNPQPNDPKENYQSEPNKDNNRSSSFSVPINLDDQHNDEFKILTADIASSLVPKQSVKFSMDHSIYNNNHYHHQNDQLNTYQTNISVGSSEDEPSQVNEFDIEKNRKQNESREMEFSKMNINLNNVNENNSSINLNELTNFTQFESKNNLVSRTIIDSQVNIPKESEDKKSIIVAHIDLFPENNEIDDIDNIEYNQQNYGKKQQIPHTPELIKNKNNLDESSLITKELNKNNSRYSMVETNKENIIEFDMNELSDPLYLLKKNFEIPKKNPFKRHLSKSYCDMVPNQAKTKSIIHTRNTSKIGSSKEQKTNLTNIIQNEKEINKLNQKKSFKGNKFKEKTSETKKNLSEMKHKKQKDTSNKTTLKDNQISSPPTKNSDGRYGKDKFIFKPKKQKLFFEISRNEVMKTNSSIQQSYNKYNSRKNIPQNKTMDDIIGQIDISAHKDIPNAFLQQFTSSNHQKSDMNKSAIEGKNTNSSKKYYEYTNCVNVSEKIDHIRIQRPRQLKSDNKIIESTTQMVLSQDRGNKAQNKGSQLNESQFDKKISSFYCKNGT